MIMCLLACGSDPERTFKERIEGRWQSNEHTMTFTNDGLFEHAMFDVDGVESSVGTYSVFIGDSSLARRIRFDTVASSCPERIYDRFYLNVRFTDDDVFIVYVEGEPFEFSRVPRWSGTDNTGCRYSDGWYPGPLIGF